MTLSRIRENNGTAVLTIPKKVLLNCGFKIGDDVRLLIGADNKCVVITKDLNVN